MAILTKVRVVPGVGFFDGNRIYASVGGGHEKLVLTYYGDRYSISAHELEGKTIDDMNKIRVSKLREWASKPSDNHKEDPGQ